jgi:hypothetical protein
MARPVCISTPSAPRHSGRLLGALRMNPSQKPLMIRLPGTMLLAACVPMVLAHGFLSFLMVFPLVSLLGGNLLQGLFLLWWLVGTAGLVVLVYSSATFGAASRRLPIWQVLGLITGVIATVPLILGFFGEWWVSVCAVLAACLSGYILFSSSLRSPSSGGGGG